MTQIPRNAPRNLPQAQSANQALSLAVLMVEYQGRTSGRYSV